MSQRPLMLTLAGGVTMSAVLVLPLLPGGAGNLIVADALFLLAICASFGKALRQPVFVGRSNIVLLSLLGLFLLHGFVSLSLAQLVFLPNPSAFIQLANYLYGALIAFAILVAVRNEEDILLLLKAWIIGGLIVGVVSTLAILGAAPSWAWHHGRRVSSTLRSVNQVQAYLGPAMMIMLFIAYTRVGRFWTMLALVSFLFGIIGMLATGSRTPLVMLALIFLFAALRAVTHFRAMPLVNSAILAVTGMSVVMLIDAIIAVIEDRATFLPDGLTGPLRRMIRAVAEMADEDDVVDALGPRGEQIAIVLENWSDRPFFGIGPGNFDHITGNRHEIHSTYFAILMEQGSIGLGIFVAFISIVTLLVLLAGRRTAAGRSISILLIAIWAVLLLYAASSFGIRQRNFWISLGLCLAFLKVSAMASSRMRRDTSMLSKGIYPGGLERPARA